MIRIGIVEDICKLGEELRSKIELDPEFSVQFIKPNGKELLKELERNSKVDVLFMDIEMPVMDGISATKEVSRLYPLIHVLVCSIYEDEESIKKAIQAGAVGYLLKDESPATIHDAIRQVISGGATLNPKIAKKTLGFLAAKSDTNEETVDYGLTSREREVLEYMRTGLTYDQIASAMFLSTGTIRKHVENLYRKLGVNNKIAAIQKLNILN